MKGRTKVVLDTLFS